MMRLPFFLFYLIMFTTFSFAQITDKPTSSSRQTISGRQLNDSITGNRFNEEVTVELDAKTHYTDYKIISHVNDTTVVDTTLSLKKERLFNHLRKQTFEQNEQHNLGAPYNHLGYDFSKPHFLPEIGIRAKHQDYLKIDDITYYRVPTPTTELFFKTGIQQGQVLNSMLTANITPQINASIGYKGLRSLGDYRNALVSHQNFRATANFETKDKRYQIKTHYVAHNLLNEENGGLTDASLLLFTTDDSEYSDRERLETNYTDAESLLKSKRLYMEQVFNLWQKTDTLHKQHSYLQLGHEFSNENQYYKFDKEAADSFIGDAYQNTIADSTYHTKMDNAIFARLKSPYVLGKLGIKATYSTYNYGYNSILYLSDQTIPSRLKGNLLTTEANWQAAFKTFSLNSAIGTIVSGDFNGSYLSGIASYSKDSLFTAKASLKIDSKSPDFNFLLYQSDFIDYNWHNNLSNENTRYLSFSLESPKLLDTHVSITQKDHYTYFDENSKPQQYSDMLQYLKVKINRTFTYKKFSLDNSLLYQNVLTGETVFKVPEFVTENSLYFTDYIFKGDPLLLQTGITFKYFTAYKADEFNPVLNEFRLQNTTDVGNFPMFDVFVNGQIRRTRLFLKAENISSFWTGRNYFATPTQPYRDFTIRFGLVWNFFI